MPKRVVLAMSGGVDSSVCAHLLQQQGYDVVGLFMRTGVSHANDHRSENKKGCCSAEDSGDARRIADRLDIPFYALDFSREFDRIIDYFADEYVSGRTPNPCVMCNNWLKFGKLWSIGRQLEADFIATGHYAQIVSGANGPELHQAVDPDKDQSYVLHGIKRRVLPHILFPIGSLTKSEVRDLARRAGLPVAEKPDSMEICFVPDNDHARVVRERRPERRTAGAFVDRSGVVLAPHDGIEQFTVGQRKGLGYAAGSRRYVLEIVPETNNVVLGEYQDVFAAGLIAQKVNWLVDLPTQPTKVTARIRSRHAGAAARVVARPDGEVEARFTEPQMAVTPGQAVVFYDGPRVLGGGWIDRPLP